MICALRQTACVKWKKYPLVVIPGKTSLMMYCSFEVGKGTGGRELQAEVVHLVGKESEETCVGGLVLSWKTAINNGRHLVVSHDVDGEDLEEQAGAGVEGSMTEEGLGGSKVLKVVCCRKRKYPVVLEDVI